MESIVEQEVLEAWSVLVRRLSCSRQKIVCDMDLEIRRCMDDFVRFGQTLIYVRNTLTYMEQDNATYLSCRTPAKDATTIDELVRTGTYLNRSDFLRAAIKKLLSEHSS